MKKPRRKQTEERETQLGLVPDVLEELKSIFHILETEGGGKSDFISLFGMVSAKYAKIKGTANEQALQRSTSAKMFFSQFRMRNSAPYGTNHYPVKINSKSCSKSV